MILARFRFKLIKRLLWLAIVIDPVIAQHGFEYMSGLDNGPVRDRL